MDSGAVLALIGGYIAAAIGVFLLYSPVLVLVLGLLIAAGLLQLLAWPFLILIRRLRHKPRPPEDGSWLLHEWEPTTGRLGAPLDPQPN